MTMRNLDEGQNTRLADLLLGAAKAVVVASIMWQARKGVAMEISPFAGPPLAGLIILAAFVVLYIWDRSTPPRGAGRSGR